MIKYMKKFTIKIKTAHFNEPISVDYHSEKNAIVELYTETGIYLGMYKNGKKLKNMMGETIKIEVKI